MAHSLVAGDSSLRLKNSYPQDDAIYERGSHDHFKLSHYLRTASCADSASKLVIWCLPAASDSGGNSADKFFAESLVAVVGAERSVRNSPVAGGE